MSNLLARAFAYKHAQAAALFQQPFLEEDGERFGRGSRVDGVKRGKLFGAGGAFALRQLAVDDHVPDSSCQLLINRPGVTHTAAPLIRGI